MKTAIALMTLAGWLAPMPAIADTTRQPLDEIRTAVTEHLAARHHAAPGGRVEIEVSRLDPRLRLANCDAPLTVAANNAQPNRGGRVTAEVRCEGSTPWRIYVPAQVQEVRPLVVAARNLPRGTILSEAHLTHSPKDINRQHRGYLVELEAAIGQVTRRQINDGAVLTPADIETPEVLRRGDRVTLVSGKPGFTVTAGGEVLSAAGLGDRVRVRNLNSKRVVEGVVESENEVHVARP
ncbi:MAG: flagellar basal body P-ring formation chaperone FlgA [Halothiobacillaceae bacterium]